MAHVALPACSVAERDGSYTNAYRIVQHSARAIPPMGECRTDIEILSELGGKLGLPSLDSLEAVRSQIASSIALYEFMKDSDSLGGVSAWDYGKAGSAARQKLSLAIEGQAPADQAYPYVLTFDNMLHFGGMTSLHSPSLAKIRVSGVLEVSEDDARSLGVEDGAIIEVKVKGGGAQKLPVRVTRELPAGVLSVPAHDFEVIRKLIMKLDASTFRAEQGTPVWFANVAKAKD
jgi:anaerobic selenocysteine-containing dehydrogenase